MYLYAARQPILDRQQDLYAYELLFRDGNDNFFSNNQADNATSQFVSVSQFEHSIADLTAGKLAHINFSLNSILKRYPKMIHPDQVVVEMADIEKPGKRLLQECQSLKEAGYKILIDNYVHNKAWIHFFPYIEMIKLDIRTSTIKDIQLMIKIKEKFSHIKIIGSKIETLEEFQLVSDAGFDYFQGFYFARPQQIKKQTVKANDYSLAELLFEVSNEVLDLDKIVSTFETDTTLTYKLLRYSNSAIFNRKVEVQSIKQAIVSLGKEELTKFVTVLFAANGTTGKPSELLTMSLLRAKFCEALAIAHNNANNSSLAFLVGMFSMLDVMLDEPMEEIVDKLKLATDIVEPLLLDKGTLADYIKFSKSYEQGNWSEIDTLTGALALQPETVSECYESAVSWANEQMSFIV